MKHTRSFYLKVVAAGLLAALSLHGDARGTTFVLLSQEDLAQGSAAIVVGTVEAIAVQTTSLQQMETDVTLRVDESVKGIRQARINVAVPGGINGDVHRIVYGAPQFHLGERVVVFLRQRADGSLTPVGLAMGKYSIIQRAGGAVVRRQLLGKGTSVLSLDKRSGALVAAPSENEQGLDSFLANIRQIVSEDPMGQEDIVVPPPSSATGKDSAGFTYLGSSPSRWMQPGLGQSVAYTVEPTGDAVLGAADSLNALSQAMDAWNGAGSRLHIENVGPAVPAPYMACDDKSVIQFNDPFGEIGTPVNCGGVLAIGGFCATSAITTSVAGVELSTISEGDLTVNDGFRGCRYWNATNLAEVLTHELGHTLGLGHSSEAWPETNPTLENATMFYLAHFDGRGASLRSDDIAAIQALYGSVPVAVNRQQACRRRTNSHRAMLRR
jgi:hypothetical protein